MFSRLIHPFLFEALGDTPVVFVGGARQVGKSTLAGAALAAHPIAEAQSAPVITLDDAAVLAAARSDPDGFVAGLGPYALLDEVQRAPDLFQAIKAAVDRDRRPGRFLLTGSANVLMLPRLSESLAGRVELLTLYGLAQAEIEGTPGRFVDALFAETIPLSAPPVLTVDDLFERVLAGGYPEAISRSAGRRREAFFDAYVTTILQRDVRDVADVAGLDAFPRLLRLLALRTGALLNLSDLARDAALARTTLDRYLSILRATYLVHLLPAWHVNTTKRLVKSPKVLMADTGLAGGLLRMTPERLVPEDVTRGALVETFVGTELLRLISWSDARPELLHYRTHAGAEVDFVMEGRDGRVVGVEVKSSATVEAKDFRGLRSLAEDAGSKFHRGVVLYLGQAMVPFEKHLHAVPMSALWHW
jgi:uncharacterized protein